MSLCLLRRSFSIASKLRCNGVLRFKNHNTIPVIPPSAVKIPAIMGGYFFEKRARKSTTACRDFSGWSPGMREATAMAATSTAERAPRYDCQLFSMLLSMSMPADEVSKAEPAFKQFPDRAEHCPGYQRHQPQLCFNRVGVALHVSQAAVVLS